jgi:CRP/FNR family transcriptional regulator, cyclic AMP receptor protein
MTKQVEKETNILKNTPPKNLSQIEIAFFLKKTNLFKDLDLDLLLSIADKVTQDVYDIGENVFKHGQRGNRMYFIAFGSVDIFAPIKDLSNQEDQKIATLDRKSFFGEDTLFNNNFRSYSAICNQDSLLLTLSKEKLLNIISECPIVAISLLQKFSKFLKTNHLENYEN